MPETPDVDEMHFAGAGFSGQSTAINEPLQYPAPDGGSLKHASNPLPLLEPLDPLELEPVPLVSSPALQGVAQALCTQLTRDCNTACADGWASMQAL